ncbi:MAG: glycosyltransferase [Rhodocyclaceae bacterium]
MLEGLDMSKAAGDVMLCSIVNEEFALGLSVFLRSLSHWNPSLDLPFLVYSGRELSPQIRASLEAEYPNVQYRIVDGALYTKCQFSNYRDWGMNPAFRYELFLNDECEQLIYFDADMLVTGDISPLLAYRGLLGACAMPAGEGMEIAQTGGFNAGMLSIGRAIRVEPVWRALVSLAESRPWSGNQTVLNLVLQQQFEALPHIYNARTSQMTPELLEQARILHYVGWRKPWEEAAQFDPYQSRAAGIDMCRRLLEIWLYYASPEFKLRASSYTH